MIIAFPYQGIDSKYFISYHTERFTTLSFTRQGSKINLSVQTMWIMKMWYIQAMELYSSLKKAEICKEIFRTVNILNVVTQAQRDNNTYSLSMYIIASNFYIAFLGVSGYKVRKSKKGPKIFRGWERGRRAHVILMWGM